MKRLRKYPVYTSIIIVLYELMYLPISIPIWEKSAIAYFEGMFVDLVAILFVSYINWVCINYAVRRVKSDALKTSKISTFVIYSFILNGLLGLAVTPFENYLYSFLFEREWSLEDDIIDVYMLTLCVTLTSSGTLFSILVDEIQRRQRRISEANLGRLKAQLRPHFIINSLSMGIGMIDSEPQKAKTYFSSLTRILRHTLEKPNNMFASLGSEIEAITPYLELMELRFPGSWKIDIDTSSAPESGEIWQGALQIILENIFKHNALSLSSPLQISIKASPSLLCISNNIISHSDSSGYGIGHSYLIETAIATNTPQPIFKRENGVFSCEIPIK